MRRYRYPCPSCGKLCTWEPDVEAWQCMPCEREFYVPAASVSITEPKP